MKRIRKRYRKAGNSGFNRLLALMLALAVCLSVTGVAVAANSIGSSPKAVAVMPNGETVEISPNSVNPDAYIDAEWLDFVCQTALEDEDSGYNSDLNDAGKAALIAEYGKYTNNEAKIPSGHLEGTAPEEVNQNGEYHAFINAEVGGVQIHSIGILEIDGTEYVYYTTNSTQPTCAVYNVLRPDDKGMPANEQEKITLNYKHMQGQLIRYNVKDDETSPAGVGNDEVFGAHPTLTTAEDGTVAFPVTIPRGYKATVTAYFVKGEAVTGSTTMAFPEGTDELEAWNDKKQVNINGDLIQKPDDSGYQSIILGAMLDYGGDDTLSDVGQGTADAVPLAENATSSLSDTITVVKHSHDGGDGVHKPGQTRLYVVVSLEKNKSYTFSAVRWLGKDNASAERWDFGYSGNGSGTANPDNKKLENGKWVLDQQSVLDKGTVLIQDGEAQWTVRAVTTYKSESEGGALNDGYTAYFLTLLEINGEQVQVPSLPEFNNDDYPLSAPDHPNFGSKGWNSFAYWRPDTAGGGTPKEETRFNNYFPKDENGQIISKDYVVNEATTTLSSGTKITITVRGDLLRGYNYVVGKNNPEEYDAGYFRTYTLKIENCQEDLTVTAMNFSSDNTKEIILTTDQGVTDVQVWNHTYIKDPSGGGTQSAAWLDVSGVNGRIINRSNSEANYNWYTDPVRFKRQVGYMPPNITIKNSAGETLWTAKNGSTGNWLGLDAPVDTDTKFGTSADIQAVKDFTYGFQMNFYWTMFSAGELLIPSSNTFDGNFGDGLITILQNEQVNPTPNKNYIDEGYRWRHSAFHDFTQVVPETFWKSRNQYNTTLYDQSYSDWTNLQTANRNDGYYYFRTNKALDRYMYTERPLKAGQNAGISYENSRGKIYIALTADPILVNVDYESNEGTTGAPITGAVSNMPEDDNSGYNVENKRTVLISPLIPQAEDYAFQHWELWVGNTQIKNEDGTPVTFTPSQSVTINEALELALQGKFDLNNLKDNTVTVTLKAIWEESTEKTAVNYDVNFWIPAETAADVQDVSVDNLEPANLSGDKKWYSIREDIHQVVDGGFVVADLYADTGGGLSQHVLNTLNGAWSSGSTDYTKNGDLQYVVATGGDLTPKPAEWTVNSKEAPPGKNYPVNIYLKVDETVSVTVTKTWQGSAAGTETAIEKPDEVYVRLQRPTAETIDESIVWSSEGIDNAEQKLTPAQAGDTAPGWTYTWEKLPGKDDSGNVYTYRVVELTEQGGNVIAEGGTLTTDDVDYTVSYGSGTAKPDPNDSKVLNAGITNQEKAADLVISKQVTGKFGDVTKPFDFTVTLKDNNGNVFDNYNGITAEKVEVKNGVAQSPAAATLSFDENGQATFTLKHNESLTIQNLPAGTGYTVEEDEEKAEYITEYATTVEGEQQEEPGEKPAAGIMSGKKVEVEVTNSKVDIALTGLRDTTSSGLLMTMAAVLLGTAIVSVSLIKRRVKGNWK